MYSYEYNIMVKREIGYNRKVAYKGNTIFSKAIRGKNKNLLYFYDL